MQFKNEISSNIRMIIFFPNTLISGVGQHGKTDGMIMILNFQISKNL